MLRALLALFGEAFEDIETYTAKQPNDDYLSGLLVSQTFMAIAALIETLQRIAAERGVYVSFVQADYGDDPADRPAGHGPGGDY